MVYNINFFQILLYSYLRGLSALNRKHRLGAATTRHVGGRGIHGWPGHRVILRPPKPPAPCPAYYQSLHLLCQDLRPVPWGLEAAICRREETDLLKRAAFNPDLGSIKLSTFSEAFRNYGSASLPLGHSEREVAFTPRSLR